MTVQERVLIFAVFAILLLGACVKHLRQGMVPEPLPELVVPADAVPARLPSLGDLEEDD